MSLTTLMFLSELVLQDSVLEYCRSILFQALAYNSHHLQLKYYVSKMGGQLWFMGS